MRITIDTEMQAIIVPDSYYAYVDKLNDIIVDAGGNALDYKSFIRTCFERAYRTKVISQTELSQMNGTRKRKPRAKTAAAPKKNENSESEST